jgi:outer membrane protein insertion porin family
MLATRCCVVRQLVFAAVCVVGCPMLICAQSAEPSLDQTEGFRPCRTVQLQNSQGSGGPEISIASVSFSGFLQMPVSEQDNVAASVKRQTYAGSVEQAKDEANERVRVQWLNRGYFKVQVNSDAHVLGSTSDSERIALSVHVDEGQQYRLRRITFTNNKAVSNLKALRSLFPIKDGDIFGREAIVKGLEHLRRAYGQLGYINFTSVPQTTFNDDNQTISLEVDVDEGKQFSVSSIGIIGVPSGVLKDLALKPGQIYNARLVEAFLQKHFPGADVNDPHVVQTMPDEGAGMVALTLDLRSCTTE